MRTPLRLVLSCVWIAVACVAVPAFATQGADPETRAEALARQREVKADGLRPYEPGGLERALLWLENDRVFERLLNPAEGVYPKLGAITSGSGFSFGPAYRRPRLFGDRAVLGLAALGSFRRYWSLDARLDFPELAGGRVFAAVYGRQSESPLEDFFGLGPDSRRDAHATYGLRSAVAGAAGGVRVAPWLSLGGRLEHRTLRIGRGGAADAGAVQDRFALTDVPGLDAQPDFLTYEVFADLNYREPYGNPREGGRFYLGYQRYDDRDLDRFTFHRIEADLQQYVPLLRDRRVLALRAYTALSKAEAGQAVPFYLQPTLGGPEDLRGFRRFRFRDENALLLQAEYRWEIFTALDGAIFYDAGKVAPSARALNLRDLETDYGIGFRFGTLNGVFLRIEGAFGSRDGKHLVVRYGHVF